ncbi:hypothetical protein BC939DRAFT_457672 [Gamsiella multidivaricata]|uniref:uncharacterized protein n=1 Tax=Gamsiella multidivaricata TaxID=101098 RepID=UPI002220F844|nr:uncharacterized protein BC939DRAFT_457672 [Gamsiella multidivaricata]KAG0359301.1 hypothetical protein BGZ54_010019 [Gamsiella multidivaricata]KAI7820555.1 hypothetical protein BC939DRAFT_457672 [Gamsiella multidivaricata]
MPPFELQQEVLPIQLPMQPLNISRRRASRAIALGLPSLNTAAISANDIENEMWGSKSSASATADSVSYSIHSPSSLSSTTNVPLWNTKAGHGTGPGTGPPTMSSRENTYTSPLTWLSRVITKAGRDERLHYHSNGHHHHHHHHGHTRSHSHSLHHHHHQQLSPSAPLTKQLFSKATVVTLERKYATVHWAAEFYCTISSPCFALPLLLYLDPRFRWSSPDIHITHFAIFLSVITAATSTLYHATLYKIFSSLDACFATIMFYMNTIQLLRSLPEPYALMVPDLISTVVHCAWTPYLLVISMVTLFIVSWRRTAMLSLSLMVLMIPASIWGFAVHEAWIGLAAGLVGLSMFAADRFKLFCGHSYWHLAGGLSLWYGIASAALAK